MGEYAIRKKDGNRIKIGTCESMYYARYEQVKDITYDYFSYNLFWRIPTPDEDDIEVGDYENWSPIGSSDSSVPYHLMIDDEGFDKKTIDYMLKSDGITQLKDERMGLLINVHCPHGLPIYNLRAENKNSNGLIQDFFYNGLRSPLYLSYLKNTEHNLRVVVSCRCCQSMWSFTFDEIEPAIKSLWMKLRLFHQCTDYWFEHNLDSQTPCKYEIRALDFRRKNIKILSVNSGIYMVSNDDRILLIGDWQTCRNAFIVMLPRPCEVSNSDEIMSEFASNGDMMTSRYLPDADVNKMREALLQ